ncbi:hypothetical protein HS5_05230 [Acidianus sp. HS-5]|nr:hypothetical protein HS5_05230 [Acidianus sp. HS-5]
MKDFLEYILPNYEKYDIKVAVHPGDPPIEEYRGVARIINSVENFDKYLNLVKKDNVGTTFC